MTAEVKNKLPESIRDLESNWELYSKMMMIPDNIKKNIMSLPKHDLAYGFIRCGSSLGILETFGVSNTEIGIICIKAALDGESSIIGYIYISNDISVDPTPSHVSLGPTFLSQDGEYRPIVLYWTHFISVLNDYASDLSAIENIICNRMESGRLTFQADFYCINECSIMEKFVNESRISIKLYMFAWAAYYGKFATNSISNHMNQSYKNVIYKPEDENAYKAFRADASDRDFGWKLYRFSSNTEYEKWYLAPLGLSCGQKISPITSLEALQPGDINFSIWKEIRISQLVTNLVFNIISPTFPIFVSWFYIPNAHVGLFDNPAMRKKYADAITASEIINQLRKIDDMNYMDSAIKTPKSAKFSRLSKEIKHSIVYAAADIKLTDLAVCMLTERVGTTLRDFPAYVASNRADLAESKILSNLDSFRKHIFEFIYGLYCANVKCGIIHGDLHLNNATINLNVRHVDLEFAVEDEYSLTDDIRVSYTINDKTYIFPFTGCTSTIIDFSRAILGNEIELVNRYGRRYTDIYLQNQSGRIIDLIGAYLPDLLKMHKASIEQLILEHNDAMFKIISALDTFALLSNFSILLEGSVSEGELAWLNDIINFTEKLTIKNINRLIQLEITSNDIEWPNLEIIHKFFNKFNISLSNKFTVVDAYSANNNLDYDISDKDRWNPMHSFDDKNRRLAEVGLIEEHQLLKGPKLITNRGEKMMAKYDSDEWLIN